PAAPALPGSPAPPCPAPPSMPPPPLPPLPPVPSPAFGRPPEPGAPPVPPSSPFGSLQATTQPAPPRSTSIRLRVVFMAFLPDDAAYPRSPSASIERRLLCRLGAGGSRRRARAPPHGFSRTIATVDGVVAPRAISRTLRPASSAAAENFSTQRAESASVAPRRMGCTATTIRPPLR